jgi:hypothetical protein
VGEHEVADFGGFLCLCNTQNRVRDGLRRLAPAKIASQHKLPDQAPEISVDYLPLAAKAYSVGHDRSPSDFRALSVHF